MSKRFARLALAGAAVAAVALPASPASAHCSWTFPQHCVDTVLQTVAIHPICHPVGTFIVCVP